MSASSSSEDASAALIRLLGRPIDINGVHLKNRIVMAPMTRMHSPEGVPGQDVASYYARRAASGVGLIITEGTYIGEPSAGGSADVPRLHGEAQLAAWKDVVAEVHAAGGVIFPQLWHLGTMRNAGEPPVPGAPVLGPSGLNHEGQSVGEPMTTEQIDRVIEAFALAAADAERAGFDGVELHGAHGYLIDGFLWSFTNRRTDAYGGPPQARARFAVEIVRAVRDRVSKSFPVHFRFSQQKTFVWDAQIARSPKELEDLLVPISEAGVDAFHASSRRYWTPEFADSRLNLAGWAKKITGKPAVTVGSVGLQGEYIGALFNGESSALRGLDDLVDRLETEEFDLVAIGRALLQDPAWAEKVLSGRFDALQAFDRVAIDSLT